MATLCDRLMDSMLLVLSDIAALDGVTKRKNGESEDLETPYIVLSANVTGERVHSSGCFDINLEIHLRTTVGNGPKASTDEEFVAYDAGIEEAVWSLRGLDLATVLTVNGVDLQVDDIFDQASTPKEFNETKRGIAYTLTCLTRSL